MTNSFKEIHNCSRFTVWLLYNRSFFPFRELIPTDVTDSERLRSHFMVLNDQTDSNSCPVDINMLTPPASDWEDLWWLCSCLWLAVWGTSGRTQQRTLPGCVCVCLGRNTFIYLVFLSESWTDILVLLLSWKQQNMNHAASLILLLCSCQFSGRTLLKHVDLYLNMK